MQKRPQQTERKHSNRRQRAGAMTVEFAIVVPIVFSVFLGCVEMSNLNFLRNMANDAAFQVARDAIVPGADIAGIATNGEDLLASMGIESTSIVATEVAGNLIEVEVTIPVDQNSWGLAELAVGRSIVQTTQLAKQIDPN